MKETADSVNRRRRAATHREEQTLRTDGHSGEAELMGLALVVVSSLLFTVLY